MDKHENRILFLKEFTKHLILNSKKEGDIFPMPILQPEVIEQQVEAKPQSQQRVSGIKKEILQPLTIQLQVKMPNPGMRKLSFFLKDMRVSMIECPGQGKFLLVRSLGRTSMAKISLDEEEIKQVIEKFSKETKIPIVPGLFKAVSGSLMITAVISETIGSRFILTRITPSVMFEQGIRV